MGRIIKRTPILTSSNRRNPDYHPEFLSTDALLIRFEPLIRSIQRKFLGYNGIFKDKSDKDDLYNQIVFEFLRLRRAFDPHRGVDFNGYIKMHLQQRVYHYVMKKQDIQSDEQLIRNFSDDGSDDTDEGNYILDIEDRDSIKEFELAEAINSIRWHELDEDQEALIRQILIHKLTPEEIAKQQGVTIKSVKQRLSDLCDMFINQYHEGDIDDRETAYN